MKLHWHRSTCQGVKLWLASLKKVDQIKVVHNQIRSVILSDPPKFAIFCKQRMRVHTTSLLHSLFGSVPTPSGKFSTPPALFSSLLGTRNVTMLLWSVNGPVPGRATAFDRMPNVGGDK